MILYSHCLDRNLIDKIKKKKFSFFIIDDSLFDSYYYYPLLKNLNYGVAITVNYIDINNNTRRYFKEKYLEYQEPNVYMKNFIKNNSKNRFLRLNEIEFLLEHNVKILGHSYYHCLDVIKFEKSNKPKYWYDYCGIMYLKNFYLGSRLAHQSILASFNEWIDFIKKDTEKMLNFFYRYFKFIPNEYVFPFNEQSEILIKELKKFGFKKFYGKERFLINEFL